MLTPLPWKIVRYSWLEYSSQKTRRAIPDRSSALAQFGQGDSVQYTVARSDEIPLRAH